MAQVEKFHCRGCGAVLPVKANAGRIKCEYCGTVHLPYNEQKKDSGDLACPNCGFANPPQAQYCGDCGRSFFHTCPKCGTQNRMDSVFCAKCGADIEKIISEEGPYKHVNIDDLYMDYLLEGKKLYGEYQRLIMLLSTLGTIVMVAGIFMWINTLTDSVDLGSIPFVASIVIWVNTINDNINLGNFDHYGPTLFVLGFVFMMIVSGLCSIIVKAKAARIAKTKPGFDKFFKAIRRQPQQPGQPVARFVWDVNWPDTLPDENKRKEFLFLIGKK
ncbi:MAG: zinc ribbon domain-containing protein [Chloroflexota bacterium]